MKALALVLALLIAVPALAAPTLELSGPLRLGSAVLVQVRELPPGAQARGSLRGETVPFNANGIALISLDMEDKPGPARLEVTVTPPRGQPLTLAKQLDVPARKYKEERLTLPDKKVELNPDDLARSERETARMKQTYERRGGVVGYGQGFRKPAPGRFSGEFGSRRILNGQPRAPHNGIDIAAPKGTAIAAPAPGVVALVGSEFFFTGNTVILDHGDGVITLYAHLDRIDVAEGARVEAGTVIGSLGQSGRATGPHLHWGARVRGDRVDPSLLPGVKH